MTDNDKELIKRLALEAAGEVEFHWDGTLFKFATRFLERYLAERGGEVFCFVKVGSDGKYGGASPTPLGPCKTPVFLAPQPAIPEGMTLVGYTTPDVIINLRNGMRYGGARISPRHDEDDGLTEPIFAAAGVKP